MPTAARRAAFQILLKVEKEASFASELLHGPLTEKLSERDAAFCTELVLGTLRWQGTLDFVARHFMERPTRLDAEVRVALRLGLYQLRSLDVPSRAAVHESVELVKSARKTSAAGLVNAVLRKGANAPLSSLLPADISDIERLSVETSHPEWLLERWVRHFGRDEAVALAKANNQPPLTFVRANLSVLGIEDVKAELTRSGLETAPGRFLKSALSVIRGNVTRAEAIRRGEIVIQDEASQLVPHLLDVQQGEAVLDLCAAPGNKTGLLARWAGATGSVIACDIHLHRLRQMRDPSHGPKVSRIVADGERALPFATCFDRILVDAPCSGTGTLRRNPELKWRLTREDVDDLAAKQLRLLENAADVLSPRGRMVYSTCSLEREENQSVVEAFLDRHRDFRVVPLAEDAPRLRPFLQHAAEQLLSGRFLETSPTRDETDGFFAAILAPSGA